MTPLPYNVPMIQKLLRAMSSEKLEAATSDQFQIHPAPVVIKGAIIRELIANERARRKR